MTIFRSPFWGDHILSLPHVVFQGLNDHKKEGEGTLLGAFSYRINGFSTQTFRLQVGRSLYRKMSQRIGKLTLRKNLYHLFSTQLHLGTFWQPGFDCSPGTKLMLPYNKIKHKIKASIFLIKLCLVRFSGPGAWKTNSNVIIQLLEHGHSIKEEIHIQKE